MTKQPCWKYQHGVIKWTEAKPVIKGGLENGDWILLNR